jgi:hypothetical protein
MSALLIAGPDCSLLPTLLVNRATYNRRRGVVYPALLPTLVASMGSGNKGGEDPDGPFRPSLIEMARRGTLPTLTASSATRGSCPGEAKRHSPNLETTLKLLPTMCRRDDHGPGTRRTGAQDLPAALGGHLNPTWCLWFMGFPADWLDVDDAHVFAHSATRSSRNKPKSSGG